MEVKETAACGISLREFAIELEEDEIVDIYRIMNYAQNEEGFYDEDFLIPFPIFDYLKGLIHGMVKPGYKIRRLDPRLHAGTGIDDQYHVALLVREKKLHRIGKGQRSQTDH